MSDRTGETSPLVYARAAGVLFLVILVCAIFGMMYVSSKVVVPDDAATTARNLVANESLVRAGLVSEAVIMLSEIALVVVLYVLLRPVSKTLSLVAASARLAMAVLQGVNVVLKLIALSLLGGADHLAAFEPAQLDSAATVLLEAYTSGAQVWGLFFGLHCLVLGYLIYKSGYFPKVLGILMAVASFGYLIDSFGRIILPEHAAVFTAIVNVTAFVGEMPFYIWLLVKGVNVQRWPAGE